METRPYEPGTDDDDLWTLKAAFERGLGAETGGETKETTYEAKLTDAYRERYLAWVGRCVADDPRCLTVAEDDGLVGYVFVLPERLAMIWDAAVVNELYVAPEHRGTGVADDLMAAACALAREQTLPLERLVLDVDPANARARAFYDRHGFEPWGEMIARPLE
ncbi:GNAT family N-acetyltransferase [Halalkalicoccus jeotgali]|uniref:GCN5-like N-acetyltransferase n=1 Tax=Halalkalicoccus jeotgali (strain DSM 18796 / CECT 7217 / JCM 14584 / KCTC 4019 / B3) TaxID=795797 RepID=D8JAK9_HALJB|nr:GNAT family N-acetyltransferase [Halalkalicoccus jeotgali]ADJ14731.1 GCN5-related N-acetyltransferase [Halalkalicoccus jeotgali B3]ELY39313.1 GCN5-like N-acetyltransferase [Halalkalicoccus jeotgali B3]